MVWWKKRTDASVIRIESGMTTEQVKDLLGRPKRQFSEEDFRKGRMMSGGGSGMSENEYWFYKNFPGRGTTTMITFREGRVQEFTQGSN